MKLTKRELQKQLKRLAKANSQAFAARSAIEGHCIDVYGVDPSEVDNDQFIDAVDGGCGSAKGMTVDEFHQSMIDAIGRNQ